MLSLSCLPRLNSGRALRHACRFQNCKRMRSASSEEGPAAVIGVAISACQVAPLPRIQPNRPEPDKGVLSPTMWNEFSQCRLIAATAIALSERLGFKGNVSGIRGSETTNLLSRATAEHVCDGRHFGALCLD